MRQHDVRLRHESDRYSDIIESRHAAFTETCDMSETGRHIIETRMRREAYRSSTRLVMFDVCTKCGDEFT